MPVGIIDSDVLRWIAQAEAGDEKRKDKKPPKWKMRINSWLRERRTGEWVRESVATTVKRKFRKFAKSGKIVDGKPEIVSVEVEELVYANDGYRPKLDGEKDTRKAFYHRGARVWR